jgi:hypothetical protein
VLLEKQEYFDSIPFKIQEHIMCSFLFKDIVDKPAFKTFFWLGQEFDSNFIFEVARGFMPRQFCNTPDDRVILTEEGDVTEIYFLLQGEWAIGYKSFQNDHNNLIMAIEENDGSTPIDMLKKGVLTAKKNINYGYIGDYYVLASKRSQFYYYAVTQVESFALTKQFMFKKIFKMFPGLHSEMLAESFSRYIKEFRKPCGKVRLETINNLNKRSQYSQIKTDNLRQTP